MVNKSEQGQMKQLVPELRFSEFEGDWNETLIGSILTVGSGKDYKHLNTGDIPVYGTGGYMTSVDEYLHDGESVCIGRKGTIDKPMLLKGRFWTVDTLFFTHSYSNNNSKFIYLIFQNINWKKYNEASGVPSLSKATIEKIKVVVPKPKEQQKIANFLTAIDQRITLLKQKKATLEDYKKGLMQKIFSQEIRFVDDEGNNFPDWTPKTLNDFCDPLSGCPVPGDEIVEFNTGISLMRGINITEGLIRHDSQIDRFHSGNIDSKKQYLLEKDDLVIAMDGSKVGKNVAFISEEDAGSFLVQRVTRLRKKREHVLKYVFYNLISERFRQYVNKVNTSSGIPHISLKQIRDFDIKMPVPEEQQKIANFLSAIDQQINAMDKQITDSELFKKGLLQRMFV